MDHVNTPVRKRLFANSQSDSEEKEEEEEELVDSEEQIDTVPATNSNGQSPALHKAKRVLQPSKPSPTKSSPEGFAFSLERSQVISYYMFPTITCRCILIVIIVIIIIVYTEWI